MAAKSRWPPRDKKPPQAAELAELKKKVAAPERVLGPKTY